MANLHQKRYFAYITSLHKKESKRNCDNYRDISIITTLFKVYASILRDLLEDVLPALILPGVSWIRSNGQYSWNRS